MDFWN
ncbi:rCG34394 [Rattus norvegicus]